jgi:protein-S-isoprenylcysteine O-methyltransferase Ste14
MERDAIMPDEAAPASKIGTAATISPDLRRKLGLRLAIRFPAGFLIAAAIVFLPAGSFAFWQGWALLAVWFLPASLIFLYFLRRDPQVVSRRLERRETVREQKLLMKLAKLIFLVILLLPGFDRRWGWSRQWFGEVPLWLTLLSLTTVLAGMLSIFWVINTNRFAASTIRVESGQTVISTGPYRWVRHPMYSGILVLWLFTPLALGSYTALPASALLAPVLVIRLLNEEKVLCEELPGYSEYCLRTRYRLIPFVW